MRPSFATTLLSLLVLSLWAQAPGSGPVSDETLYWGVFHRIQLQETFTSRLASEGKDTKAVKSSLQKQTGLTDAEWTLVRAVALDFIAMEQGFMASRTQVFAAIKSGWPKSDEPRPSREDRERL